MLRNYEAEWSDEVYIYRHMDHVAGIVTPEFELAYVHNYYSYEQQGLVECNLKPPDSDGVLFDRIRDPLQVNNLINRQEYAQIVAELTKKILDHNRAINSPTMNWLRELDS